MREAALCKLAKRAPVVGGNKNAKPRGVITLVLTFMNQLLTLRLAQLWDLHFLHVIPLRLRLAWRVKPNALRRLYRLNWPCSVLDRTGFG